MINLFFEMTIFHNFFLDVKNRCMDMKSRKPFGLRSDYVQIAFNYVQITFDLCKNYVKIT